MLDATPATRNRNRKGEREEGRGERSHREAELEHHTRLSRQAHSSSGEDPATRNEGIQNNEENPRIKCSLNLALEPAPTETGYFE